ncbi:MAG: class I SAM-dependent methyltransferase [Opitutaceae bacterium]|nr:class I SAM-dependent methyltransferase [Opitutaceae bacterium]
MPTPEIYEEEYRYWPWGKALNLAAKWAVRFAPSGGVVLDYMCGTGYLLHQIARKRNDLRLVGCSLTASYVRYGRQKYPELELTYRNALRYKPRRMPDLVLCTAGLHHLSPNEQPRFVRKIAKEMAPNRWLILGDEVIRPYTTETQRRSAVIDLAMALIRHLVAQRSPPEVIQAALDVLQNDLFQAGEYKTSLANVKRLLAPYFVVRRVVRTWPNRPAPFGDYLLLCQRR